MWIMASISRRR